MDTRHRRNYSEFKFNLASLIRLQFFYNMTFGNFITLYRANAVSKQPTSLVH